MIIGTKKSMWVLLSVLIIVAWILGPVSQATAETLWRDGNAEEVEIVDYH